MAQLLRIPHKQRSQTWGGLPSGSITGVTGLLALLLLAIVLLGSSTVMLVSRQRCSLNPADSTAMSISFKSHHQAQVDAACLVHPRAEGLQLNVTDNLVAPVVVVAYNRVHYLAKCLTSLLKSWSVDPANTQRFPLFVSVDGGDHNTVQFAAAFNYPAGLQVIHNMRHPGRCPTDDLYIDYCNLSMHYLMLLQLFFDCHKVSRLIFLEEDLEIAPDFFSYFSAFAPVLDRDESLMCVSAWNDHGQPGRALNATAVYRTDIFPGLGWMLNTKMALELMASWPDRFWDDHLRRPDVRRGRQCIYPEVPRTRTYGKEGASAGQFFSKFLENSVLSEDVIDWHAQNTSMLLKEPYKQQMSSWLAGAQPIQLQAKQLVKACKPCRADPLGAAEDLLVRYTSNTTFQELAVALSPMMHDLKGRPSKCSPPAWQLPLLPRGSYDGVVVVRCHKHRLFIAPEAGSPADPSTWGVAPSDGEEDSKACHDPYVSQQAARRESWRSRSFGERHHHWTPLWLRRLWRGKLTPQRVANRTGLAGALDAKVRLEALKLRLQLQDDEAGVGLGAQGSAEMNGAEEREGEGLDRDQSSSDAAEDGEADEQNNSSPDEEGCGTVRPS